MTEPLQGPLRLVQNADRKQQEAHIIAAKCLATLQGFEVENRDGTVPVVRQGIEHYVNTRYDDPWCIRQGSNDPRHRNAAFWNAARNNNCGIVDIYTPRGHVDVVMLSYFEKTETAVGDLQGVVWDLLIHRPGPILREGSVFLVEGEDGRDSVLESTLASETAIAMAVNGVGGKRTLTYKLPHILGPSLVAKITYEKTLGQRLIDGNIPIFFNDLPADQLPRDALPREGNNVVALDYIVRRVVPRNRHFAESIAAHAKEIEGREWDKPGQRPVVVQVFGVADFCTGLAIERLKQEQIGYCAICSKDGSDMFKPMRIGEKNLPLPISPS